MIIVGLGNPGTEYARTRHNAGFLVVEEARRRWGGGRWRRQRAAVIASVQIGRARHSLVRPMTFMNRSGDAVTEVMGGGAGPNELFVILDDMDLPLGRLRLRGEGGAGGHRGLHSVLAALAPASVARMRVGVGRPREGADAVEHVLDEFTPVEWTNMERMVARAVDALEVLLTRGLTAAMDRYNGLPAPWEEREGDASLPAGE
ncbi:MAG: aminoacyl-tRNA hydrolase [Candidatus Eisenbacteria bacterium]